jgi:catechol 2,3-dioxygenase-like lactoylglutathione lyase family enzyme
MIKERRMFHFSGIHHLAMVTADMSATIRFWRDLLGMKLVGGFGRPGYRHYFFEISESDMIAFFEWPSVEPVPLKDPGAPVTGPVAFDHIAFGVDRHGDLWRLRDLLEAAGFWVSEVVDHGFIHSLYTFDPNQIPLEFTFSVQGKDLRKFPAMADKNPVKAALEGTFPTPGVWPEVVQTTLPEDRRVYPGEGWSAAGNAKAIEIGSHGKDGQ